MIPTIIPEGSGYTDIEQCCFCWMVTRRWTDVAGRKPSEQVACCVSCAKEREPSEVPTKDEWWDRSK